MKVKVGAILVLIATLALFPLGSPSHYDALLQTQRQILSVVVGLTGYAIVILGVIASPPKKKRFAIAAASVLLLPALLLCGYGAHLISIGWFGTLRIRWLGVLGVVSAFVIPALFVAAILYLLVSWMGRRYPQFPRHHGVVMPLRLSRGFAMRLIAGAILIHAGVTFYGQSFDRWSRFQSEFVGIVGLAILGGIGLLLIASGRRAKRD